MTVPLSYVLPLRSEEPLASELVDYLRALDGWVDELIVVDGSTPSLRAEHQASLDGLTVVPPQRCTGNGKVAGVLTGVGRARHDRVVIADDDVRYERDTLERIVGMLDGADVVRPQNYFAPIVWHAVVDTARSSLNRVTTGDWPGTLAIRRSVLLAAGGYSGEVLFENLELVRTMRAVGGREAVPMDLYVRRIPPSTAHFARQQVRQAYDELARPARLVVSLAVAPAFAVLLARRSWRTIAISVLTTAALAEAGRRRSGGRRVFHPLSSVLAPGWLLWRSCCSWIAIGTRLRGGARYHGTRLRVAAHSTRALRHATRRGG